MIALDTHVVVWLHAGETDLLPNTARIRLDLLTKDEVILEHCERAFWH